MTGLSSTECSDPSCVSAFWKPFGPCEVLAKRSVNHMNKKLNIAAVTI